MHLSSFYVETQGKGKCPLPLQPIPKNNRNPKNKAWSFTQKIGHNHNKRKRVQHS